MRSNCTVPGQNQLSTQQKENCKYKSFRPVQLKKNCCTEPRLSATAEPDNQKENPGCRLPQSQWIMHHCRPPQSNAIRRTRWSRNKDKIGDKPIPNVQWSSQAQVTQGQSCCHTIQDVGPVGNQRGSPLRRWPISLSPKNDGGSFGPKPFNVYIYVYIYNICTHVHCRCSHQFFVSHFFLKICAVSQGTQVVVWWGNQTKIKHAWVMSTAQHFPAVTVRLKA